MAFGLGAFLSGTLWTAFNIFILGHYMGKFGPAGSFYLETEILAVGSVLGMVVFAITLAIRKWPQEGEVRRGVAFLFGPLYLLLVMLGLNVSAGLARMMMNDRWETPVAITIPIGVAVLLGAIYPVSSRRWR